MSLTLVIGSRVGLFDRNTYDAQLRTYSINQNANLFKVHKIKYFAQCCCTSFCAHVSYTAYKVWRSNMEVEGSGACMWAKISVCTMKKTIFFT